MTVGDTEPVVSPVFTMIASDTAVACDGDSCAIVADSKDVTDDQL